MSFKKIVNIVNFMRGADWRYEEKELFDTFVKELELCKKYQMPYTFLMLYDALIKPEWAAVLSENKDSNMEVGLWLELSREAVERAGLEWNEEHEWTWHVNPGMLLGYNIFERARIIDELMARFFDVFGYYPRSVGSWIIDTFSINYMKEKYGIKAVCICREQYGTDGYTLWGGYYNQGYYPSKNNMFMPAQTTEEQVNVPIFRMLGPDPIYQYDIGLDDEYNMSSIQHEVLTLEPAYGNCGASDRWVDWFLDTTFENESLNLAYTQVGQENSFTWKVLGEGLQMQMEKISDGVKNNRWDVMTLGDTGEWFADNFDSTPATAVTALSDWKNEGNQTVWYDSKNYRVNLHNRNGSISVRDLFLFNEKYRDKYLDTPAPGDDAVFDTLPVIDGYRWGGNGKRSALYFVKAGTCEAVCGKILSAVSQGDSALKITLLLDGEEVVCVCDEDKLTFDFSNSLFDMLFCFDSLGDTIIKEIGDNFALYEHSGFEYGIKLSCGIKAENGGYRIISDEKHTEISFI